MKPEYAIQLYNQEEAFRFLKFHRELSRIFSVPFNELYSCKEDWTEIVLKMLTKQRHVNEEEPDKENEAEVKAVAVGT